MPSANISLAPAFGPHERRKEDIEAMNFSSEIFDALMLAFGDMQSIRDREQFARALKQEVTFDHCELKRLNGLLGICRRFMEAHHAEEHRNDFRAVLKAHATVTYMIAKIQGDEGRMVPIYEELGAW